MAPSALDARANTCFSLDYESARLANSDSRKTRGLFVPLPWASRERVSCFFSCYLQENVHRSWLTMRLPGAPHWSRISTIPATISIAAMMRGRCNGSFSTITAIAVANSTLVSRSAATSAIGATVIAQIAIQ